MFRNTALAALGLLLCASPKVCSSEPHPLAEDRRLDGRVTVSRARIYLGELLEELGRQRKLSLTVEQEKGPLDGIELGAFLTGRPLRETMEGLTELLSHRHHRCEWKAVGSGYVLRHYPTLAAGAAAMQASVRARWAQDVRTYHEIVQLPETARTERMKTRKDLFPPGTPSGKLDLIASLDKSRIESLLRGTQVVIDPNGLTATARQALSMGRISGTRTRTSTTPLPPPGFFVSWDSTFLSPALWMQSEGVAENVVGGLGWDQHWFQTQGDGWRFRLDAEFEELYHKMMRREPDAGGELRASTVPAWLKALKEKQPVNMLVDLVTGQAGGISNGWLGRTPEQSAVALAVMRQLQLKKLGEIHLLRGATATVDPRPRLVPWGEIKALRASASRSRGFLSLEDLLRMSRFSPPQLAQLSEEFRDTELLPVWRPVLRFREELEPTAQERLRSAQGLPLRDTGLVARAALADYGGGEMDVRGLAFLEKHGPACVLSLRFEEREKPEAPPLSQAARANAAAPPAAEASPPEDLAQGWRLVWRIKAPNGDEHLRRLLLLPRRPLRPE
jgi:hypothetical protein